MWVLYSVCNEWETTSFLSRLNFCKSNGFSYARAYQALSGPKVFSFRVIAKKSRRSSLGCGHYKSTMHLAFFVGLVLIWGEAYSATITQFYQPLTPILYATSRFFVRCIICANVLTYLPATTLSGLPLVNVKEKILQIQFTDFLSVKNSPNSSIFYG